MIGNIISSTTTLNTGIPQGCMLTPLLFTLLCFKHFMMFTNDIAAVGLISSNDESAYRKEVEPLAQWFRTTICLLIWMEQGGPSCPTCTTTSLAKTRMRRAKLPNQSSLYNARRLQDHPEYLHYWLI